LLRKSTVFKFISLVSASLLLGAFAVSPAMAQLAGNQAPKVVEAKLSVFQVGKNAEGKEALLPTNKAAPGDTLEYQTLYQNSSQSAVKSLAATLPLPPGLAYVPGSARPANAQASTDGKIFAAMPLKVMVKAPSGKIEEQLVPYSDYRALRWNVGDLPVSEKVTVSARALVNPVSGSVAAPGKTN
jgi:uncharacterized repeat protein (TIGR01451 family)